MSTFWNRAIATTTIALVASLGLTACNAGGTEPGTEPGTGTTQTDPSTGEGTTTASTAMTADDFAERINDAQYAAGSTHFVQTVDAGGQAFESSGEMIIAEDPADMRMSMRVTGGMEMRFVGGEMYLSMGEATANKFVHLSGEDNPITKQLTDSLDQANLGQQVEVFKSALRDFSSEAGETIDGVETTKYTLTLDTEELFAAQGTEIPADAGLGETIDYILFAGDDDLPRRMVMDIAGSEVVMEFSAWGEPVTVEAPTADEITDQQLF